MAAEGEWKHWKLLLKCADRLFLRARFLPYVCTTIYKMVGMVYPPLFVSCVTCVSSVDRLLTCVLIIWSKGFSACKQHLASCSTVAVKLFLEILYFTADECFLGCFLNRQIQWLFCVTLFVFVVLVPDWKVLP